MGRILLVLACLAATVVVPIVATGDGDSPQAADRREQAQWRRPTAAAWLEPGRICVVANSRSGTLSRVAVANRRIIDETPVAARIADLVPLGDSGRLLVLDDKSHELIVVRYDAAGRLAFEARAAVSPYPIRITVSPDRAEAAVACLWSRCIDVVALRPRDSAEPAEVWNAAFPQVVATIPLSFNPRAIAFTPDGERLLVADAFGGNLAVIDWRTRKVAAVHRLDGHNLHGFAVDVERRTVAVVGQQLDPQLPATAANLRSGALLKNRLWRMAYDRLSEPTPLAATEVEIVELDQYGVGAGDPIAVALTPGGETLIALGGTAETIIVGGDGAIRRRYDVGSRPVALLPTPDERAVLVVNRLDDSLSLVDLQTQRVDKISLGPTPKPYPRDRGEVMFFDARPTPGGRMSCHSCHPDGHTNGLTSDTFGDGDYGNPKRVLSLRGTALTDHWSWNGQLRELRDQIRQSLESTMHQSPVGPERHDDLVAFLHTLPFAPAPEPKPLDEADRKLLERGRLLFDKWKCGGCHIGPLTYTSQGVFDVSLRDERGLAKFNPPSLRGVGQGAAFFHDGRAASLDEVLHVYQHQVPAGASEADLDAVVRFLRSL